MTKLKSVSRILKLERILGEVQESEELGIPIIPLSPEKKAVWPKGLPYPIIGNLFEYEMQKDITK